MKDEKKPGSRTSYRIGFCLLLAVVFLMVTLQTAARSKEHGARIIITKLDGQRLEGELLKVKDTGLILMTNSESGVAIPVKEIKTIELKKKGKFLTGAAIGLGVSMIAGGIFGSKMENEGVGVLPGIVFYGGLLGIPTGLLCGGVSAQLVRHKTYNLVNEKPEKISKILEKLKSKSRF